MNASSDNAGSWISAQDALTELERARPNEHAGKDLANGAMKAGFRMRARMAVFFATDGSGHLAKREHDFDVPPEWWWGERGPGLGYGLQVFDATKGEAWATLPVDGKSQRVELFGITFHRSDLAAHFSIDVGLPADRPARGFTESDLALMEPMRKWIERTGQGITAASVEFASQAKGAGTDESKAKRLERRYTKQAKP